MTLTLISTSKGHLIAVPSTTILLLGFRANVDLQPVFNHYKCVTYVCSYLTKDETESSQAIVQAAEEATALNLPVRDS